MHPYWDHQLLPGINAFRKSKWTLIYTRHTVLQAAAEMVKDNGNEREDFFFTSLPGTLNSPVYKESPWAVSDIVESAIVAVLQDPHEEECPQSAGGTWLTSIHINQAIIH